MIRLLAFAFSAALLAIGSFFCAKTVLLLIRYGQSDAKTLGVTIWVALLGVAAVVLWLFVLKRLRREIRAFKDAKRDPLWKLGT